jgi:hypothetical protein
MDIPPPRSTMTRQKSDMYVPPLDPKEAEELSKIFLSAHEARWKIIWDNYAAKIKEDKIKDKDKN